MEKSWRPYFQPNVIDISDFHCLCFVSHEQDHGLYCVDCWTFVLCLHNLLHAPAKLGFSMSVLLLLYLCNVETGRHVGLKGKAYFITWSTIVVGL